MDSLVVWVHDADAKRRKRSQQTGLTAKGVIMDTSTCGRMMHHGSMDEKVSKSEVDCPTEVNDGDSDGKNAAT